MPEPFQYRLKAEAEEILAEKEVGRRKTGPLRIPVRRAKLKFRAYKKNVSQKEKILRKVLKKKKVRKKTIIDTKPKKLVPKKYIKGIPKREITSKTKRYGLKKPKGGPNWFGPYPAPLGEDIIINIKINEQGIYFVEEGLLSKDEILAFMRKVYFELYAFMVDLIKRFVPKDTGDLRAEMIYKIGRRYSTIPSRGTRLKNLELLVVLGANLPYAGIVAKMPTCGKPHVRHHRSQGQRSWRTGKYLHDPEAAYNFYRTILEKSWGMAANLTHLHFGMITIPSLLQYEVGGRRWKPTDLFEINYESKKVKIGRRLFRPYRR